MDGYVLVPGVLAVDDDPEASLLAAALNGPDGEVVAGGVPVATRGRELAEVDVVEGVAETELVERWLELVAVPVEDIPLVDIPGVVAVHHIISRDAPP